MYESASVRERGTEPPMEAPLAVVRFAHYLAAMFVFGAGVYLAAFAPPALSRKISPPLRRAAIAASLVALATALVWFVLEGASMGGDWSGAYDPDTLSDVLTSTDFGAVWMARVPLIVALVAALVFSRAERWGLATIFAALVLASLSLIDHGAKQSGAIGYAHRANDATHLLIAGGWLGGLTPFAMCLGAGLRRDAETAMLRFSAVGHFAVAALVLTGVVNIALTTGGLPLPPTTPYRALLATKILVVAVMITFAVANRYVLLPLVETRPGAARALRISSLVELALAPSSSRW